MELDEIDWALLDALQTDASQSQQTLAERLRVSAPTVLRRVRRLRESGLIAATVALLAEDQLATVQGHGLTAIAEVSLDRQGAEHQEAFERRACSESAVQQCYRVSPGPDFVLVLRVTDMPAWQALAERLFTQNANVRNVRVFFSTRCARFKTALPLLQQPPGLR